MSAKRNEWAACASSAAYFIDRHIWIEDPNARVWLPFHLWRAQYETLQTVTTERLVVILKARQLGLTWLVLAYALWLMIFRPGTVVLMFSMRDDEAIELLDHRLAEMHKRLPLWMRQTILTQNQHEIVFGNGSRARAFSTTKKSGRSFTGTLAIIDEADYIDGMGRLLTAVKPTIDAGGQMVILSTSNKELPESEFKRVYREAVSGRNSYKHIFLPWWARPDRTTAWYRKQSLDYTRDDLWQEYPETPEQALAQRQEAARFSAAHLALCRGNARPLDDAQGGPAIPGLTIYETPKRPVIGDNGQVIVPGGRYLISCDTSEGDLTSDYSPAIIWDRDRWEEVGMLTGRFEPAVLARYLARLADWYNAAVIVVERNNHGHAVHVALNELDASLLGINVPRIYLNPFDNKLGWLSNAKYKTLAIDWAAEVFRDGACVIHSPVVMSELAGIQAATLKALEGMYDDHAMAAVIGLAALHWDGSPGEGESVVIPGRDPLAELSFDG